MKKTARFISVVLIIVCGVLFLYELYPVVVWSIKNYSEYKWLGIGFAGYYVVRMIPVLRKNEDWLQVFSHELSHTLVGLLFFQEIHSFNAGEREGRITHSGNNFGDLFISLAPYTLPFYTYAVLFLTLLIKPEFVRFFEAFAGLTWAFHIKCFTSQTGNYQTDISKQGFFRAYAFIITAHFLNLSIILLSVRSGIIDANIHLFTAYWSDIQQAYQFVVNLVTGIL